MTPTEITPAERNVLILLEKKWQEAKKDRKIFAADLVQSQIARNEQEANKILQNFERKRSLL